MSTQHTFKRLPTIASRFLSVGLASLLVATPLQAVAADLEAIQKRGRLIVAVKDNVRPLGFREADGQFQGLEIDLARQLAQEILGRPDAVEFRPVPNQNRFAALLNDEVDIAIAKVTLTPSRLRILSFSLPYYADGTTLITRDPSVRTLSDLNRKAIAVLNGSSAIEAVRRRLPEAKLVSVDSYEDAKTALETGGAIAFAADASILTGWVQEFPQYRLLTPLLSTELLSVVIPKGHQYSDLKQQIDQTLTRLRSNGWLTKRAIYWGLPVR
ncbi:MAG: transporter substrate-binding domain-containing protein [Leptolyngbyaceae cyanobacterium RU_5_1]|nr:transporter substrate-binding domain-containing protein [Leptolyngbyaceae cyanobacterium RU_5_1]